MVRHSTKRVSFRSPKRSIQRVRAYIDEVVTTSETLTVLFTPTEDMTLVRMRVQGSMLYVKESVAINNAEMSISIAPRSVKVIENLVSGVLTKIDDDIPDTDLFTCLFQALNNTADQDIDREFRLDNKAQRKLTRNDNIELRTICSTASAWNLLAVVDMWFKLA